MFELEAGHQNLLNDDDADGPRGITRLNEFYNQLTTVLVLEQTLK